MCPGQAGSGFGASCFFSVVLPLWILGYRSPLWAERSKTRCQLATPLTPHHDHRSLHALPLIGHCPWTNVLPLYPRPGLPFFGVARWLRCPSFVSFCYLSLNTQSHSSVLSCMIWVMVILVYTSLSTPPLIASFRSSFLLSFSLFLPLSFFSIYLSLHCTIQYAHFIGGVHQHHRHRVSVCSPEFRTFC